MPKIVSINEKRKKYRIRTTSWIGGKLKERFLDEMDKGVHKEGDIVRLALDQYLPQKKQL